MKRLLFLFPLLISAQVTTIPNTTFPAVRSMMNGNFGWLNTNKAGVSACPANQYAIQTTTAGVVCASLTSGQLTTALGFTPENPANKGQNGGYLGIGADGSVTIGAPLPTDAPTGSVGAAAVYVGQTPIHPPGAVWVFAGDSIIAGSTALSYATQAGLLANGAITVVNKGAPGETCAQIAARFAADVVALKPNVVHIMCGSNDAFGGGAASVSIGHIRTMAAAALAAGITPVLGTVPPRVGAAAAISALNAGIATLAARLHIQVVDFYAALVDPSTRDYLTGLGAGDSIHPSAAGGRVMATALLATASSLIPTWRPYLERTGTDATNLIPNSLFLTNTTGWSPSADVTPTLVADAAIAGQWARLTKTGAGAGYFNQAAFVTTGFSVGQTLAFSGRIRTTGVESGGCAVTVMFWPYDVNTAGTGSTTVVSSTADIAASIFYKEIVIPATTTKFNVGVQIASGACVVDVAQLTIINLTALGL